MRTLEQPKNVEVDAGREAARSLASNPTTMAKSTAFSGANRSEAQVKRAKRAPGAPKLGVEGAAGFGVLARRASGVGY